MFKKSTKKFKSNFFSDTPLKMSFLPKDGESFINSDFGINIDKIEILKNCGIAFYLKNQLVKYIKTENVYVVYMKPHDCFKVIYSTDFRKKLKNKDVDFNNSSFFIRYGFVYNDNYSKNLSIGDTVIPTSFKAPFKNHEGCFCDLTLSLLYEVSKDKEKNENYVYNEEKYAPLLNTIFNSFGYVIKDSFIMNDKKVYLIELSEEKINELKKDESVDSKKIIKQSFIDEDSLSTKESINKSLKSFIEH